MVSCRRAFILWLVFVLLSASAQGQTTAVALPTSVDVLVLPATGDQATVAPAATRTTVIGTLNATSGVVTPNAQCGRSPLQDSGTTIPLVNPTTAEFDDPFTAGKKCVALLPVGLPDGAGYRSVVIATAPTCTVGGKPLSPCPSQRSLVGTPPFSVASILTPPAVLTGLVVRP